MIYIEDLNKTKIGNVATISTGLVIKRKQSNGIEKNDIKYKMLTLKSFDQNGWLNSEEIETFHSNEKLDERYLTQVGDVIIRLSSPFTAIVIDKEHTGILISSLFVVIRLKLNVVLPEYLCIYLNNSKQLKNYYNKNSIGSAIQIINTNTLKESIVFFPNLNKQNTLIEINKLVMKEKKLLNQLCEEKFKYHEAVLNKILQGEIENGH